MHFGTQTNFYMQKSMVMFTLSFFDPKYPFRANSVLQLIFFV